MLQTSAPGVVAAGDVAEDVLRFEDADVLPSVYLRDGRIVSAQLVGDIRAPGIYRSLMLRRTDVSAWGARIVEPTFGIGDIVFDSLVGLGAAR